MPLTVTVEQAACNALRTWLASQLPGVEIRSTWPDDDRPLPALAITVLLVGKATDEWTTPRQVAHENIHDQLPAELDIDTAAIVDTPTANDALNALRARFIEHLSDTAAHAEADGTTTVTAPAVADLEDLAAGLALGNHLRAVIGAHQALVGPHDAADALNAPTAPAATNEATLVALAQNLVHKLDAHFAARLFTWMVGVRVAPVQLDIWATYEATREDLIARLEQAVRVGTQTAGASVWEEDEPVGLSVAVQLGDNWAGGHYATFDFEAPTRDGDAQTNEWRATYVAMVDVPMLAKAQTARLARIALPLTVDAAAGSTVAIALADNAEGFTETITDG